MKKGLALIFIFFLGSLSHLNAQQQRGWNDAAHSVQKLITDYGDHLNLTDEQKAELVAKSLEHRQEVQRRHIRSDRRQGAWGAGRSGHETRQRGYQRERGERSSQRAQRTERDRGSRQSGGQSIIKNVLTEEQAGLLQELRIERIEKQFEYRILQNRARVDMAGLDEEKSGQVLAVLNRMGEKMKTAQINRINNPGEQNRETMRESAREMRELHDEILHLLTAAEYQKLRSVQGVAGQRRFMMRRGR